MWASMEMNFNLLHTPDQPPPAFGACVHVCASVYGWRRMLEATGQHQVSSSVAFHHTFWDSLKPNLQLTNFARLASQLVSRIFLSPNPQHCTMPGFYVGAGNPNSGPHVYTSSNWAVSPGCQPSQISVFHMELKERATQMELSCESFFIPTSHSPIFWSPWCS